MERWQIKPLDLVDIVLYEKLPVYEPDGRLVDCEWEDAIRANHPGPYPPPPPKDDPTIYDLIFNPLSYDYKIHPIYPPSDFIPLANRIEQCLFRLSDVEGFEKEHNILQDNMKRRVQKEIQRQEINSIDKKDISKSGLIIAHVDQNIKRKKNNRQELIEKVRRRAGLAWIKDPTITIEAMSQRDEISTIAVKKDGTNYTIKTIRNWIKDMAPNRSPGRRPEKEAEKSHKSKKGVKDLPSHPGTVSRRTKEK